MVWDQQVKLIVMLCPVRSATTDESMEYWDEYQELQRVRVVSCNTVREEGFVERIITLLHQNTGETRKVRHCQMDNWEDNKAVTIHSDSYKVFQHLQDMVSNERIQTPETPVIIHCSAGVGRTGTFIAVQLITESVKAL